MVIVMLQSQGASKAIGSDHLIVGHSSQEIKLFKSFPNGLLNAVKQEECSRARLRYDGRVKPRKIVRIPSIIDITIGASNFPWWEYLLNKALVRGSSGTSSNAGGGAWRTRFCRSYP